MYCCSKCFGEDRFLKSEIENIALLGGDCCCCGSTNVALTDATLLREHIDYLLSIYEPSDDADAKSIINCLVDDWAIFKNKDPSKSIELLEYITNDKSINASNYKATALECNTPKEKWTKFCDELISKYRFLPDNAPHSDWLPLLFENLVEEINGAIYRARIESEGLIELDKMGMPPTNKSTGGRANPVGIPYLYAASTPSTAIAEVRPHPGHDVTVAIFTITEPLRIINLINPRQTITFGVAWESSDDDDYLLRLRYDIEILSHLGEVLAKPVLPDQAAIEYLPTQYLCELIKKEGYDGIQFKSSVGNGVNYVLFNEAKVIRESVSSHHIQSLTYNSTAKP